MSRSLPATEVAGLDGAVVYVSRGDDGITSLALAVTRTPHALVVELVPEDAQRLADLLRTEPLMATVEIVAALDEVLGLARRAGDLEADASIRQVEKLRAQIRESLT